MNIQVETKYYYFTPSGEKQEVITPNRVSPYLLAGVDVNSAVCLRYLNPYMTYEGIQEFLDLTSPKKKETVVPLEPTMSDKVLHFAIDSNVISHASYDMMKKELVLRFQNGKEGTTAIFSDYIYLDVPFQVLADFLNSASKGSFFNADIRDKYKTAKFVS